jgi:hypothetical protein
MAMKAPGGPVLALAAPLARPAETAAPTEPSEAAQLLPAPGVKDEGAEAAPEGSERAAYGREETIPSEAATEEMPAEGAEVTALEEPTAVGGFAESSGILAPPAPQPEQLRAQIPTRELTAEEFLATVMAYPTAADERAAIQTLLQKLNADAERAKATVLDIAEQCKAEIFTETEIQVAMVESAMQANLETVGIYLADQRTVLTAQIEAMRATVESEGAVYLGQVPMALAMRNVELLTGVAQRQTEIEAFAQRESGQPPVVAEEEITQARSGRIMDKESSTGLSTSTDLIGTSVTCF